MASQPSGTGQQGQQLRMDQHHAPQHAPPATKRPPLVAKDANVHVRQVGTLSGKQQQQQPHLQHDKHTKGATSQKSEAPPSRRSHSPTVFKTPKKRAVPREGTHSRNVVLDDQEDGSPPHKKSRSSKNDSSGEPHGSASGAISRELGKMQFDEAAEKGVLERNKAGPEHAIPGASLRQGSKVSTQSIRMDKVNQGARSVASANALRPVQQPAGAPARSPVEGSLTTTVRVDRHSRLSAAERAVKDEAKRQQTEQWRQKYSHAFPKFVFYLDGFDGRAKSQIAETIQACGAKIDPFFSKNCTHVVTSRKTIPAVPPPSPAKPSQEATASSSKSSSSLLPSIIRKPITKRFSPSKKNFLRRNKDTPLHSDRNPFDDSSPATMHPGVNDSVTKALEWNLRVWTSDKFWSTMSILIGRDLNDDHARAKQDLAEMLRHEKLHGTLERDVNAPRDDMIYFDKRAIYVFVGDATLEHRPIMNFEFDIPESDTDQPPPWPVLYGEDEGRCPFTWVDPEKRARRQRRLELAQQAQAEAEQARQEEVLQLDREHSLRRCASHNSVQLLESLATDSNLAPRDYHGREASPYQLASGNSISMASNVTSMVTTGSQAMLAGGLAPQDKRVAQLSRRMVSPAPSRMLEQQHQQHPTTLSIAAPVPKPAVAPSAPSAPGTPALTGADARAAHVRSLLGMSNNAPGDNERAFTRSTSVDTALHQQRSQHVEVKDDAARQAEEAQAQAQLQRQLKQQQQLQKLDKKPYCENCRESYTCFDTHIKSEKHRKFAKTDKNFAYLDEFLNRITRPMAPWVSMPQYAHYLQPDLDDEEFEDFCDEDEEQENSCATDPSEGRDEGSYYEDDDEYEEDGVYEERDGAVEGTDCFTPLGDSVPQLSYTGDEFVDYEGLQGAFATYDGEHLALASQHSTHGDGNNGYDVSNQGEQSYETNTSYEEDEDHQTPHTSPEAEPRHRDRQSPSFLRLDDKQQHLHHQQRQQRQERIRKAA
ncbi:unnamed protein product [Sympodiomycopsis kandeliae]